ncbi:MAG: DNA topoisomerase IB [Actinomycetota bacterium]|nr:DNA topoisomerase IB [Actinomycetota bacterium]
MTRAGRRAPSISQIVALHEDAQACALAAGLRYVSSEEPGIRRVRSGRGFSYRDATGAVVPVRERRRIEALAIPPAWREVWICTFADGHLLAIGDDERGRRQYLYNELWRAYRDRLNFYRLIDFGTRLPAIRDHVQVQLRRRTWDRDVIMAAMLRIIDARGLRVGNEIYAEENDSYGLSTLTKRHVQVRGSTVDFCFPAKSGKQAVLSLSDAAVARVVARLLDQRGRRLFAVSGEPISSDEVNERLGQLTEARVTAKDFRTWHGTRVAFGALRRQLPPGDAPERNVLAAVDAAAEFLGNTRTVARAHYVHPDVLMAYLDGTFAELVAQRRPARLPGLDADERAQLSFLMTLLRRSGVAATPTQTSVP